MAEVELIVIDIDLLLGGIAHPIEDDLTKVREVNQVFPVSVGFQLKYPDMIFVKFFTPAHFYNFENLPQKTRKSQHFGP